MMIGPVLKNAELVGRAPPGTSRKALERLSVGDAFDWNGPRSTVVRMADRMGIKISTRTVAPGLFRIYRTG